MENIIKPLKDFAYVIFIFLGMKTDVVKILFILMTIDSILGIVKALVLGQRFSFKKLLIGMTTKLTLLIVPFILALMAKALSFDFYYFVVAVMNIIVVSEGISCVTNIISIKTKETVENADYMTRLLQAIKNGLHNQITKLLKIIEGEKNRL